MKQVVLILFISLRSFFVYAADAEDVKAVDHQFITGGLAELFKEQSAYFEREAILRSSDSVPEFITPDRLADIHTVVMRIPSLFEDYYDGCRKRTRSIKSGLDKMKVWNKAVYLGVTYKNKIDLSPFVFGPGPGWNHHWANLVAVEGPDGSKTLMMIDPIVLDKGPRSLNNWFNELVAGDKMYDKEHWELNIYGPVDMTPLEDRIPTKTDLMLRILDDIPGPKPRRVGR